MNDFCPAVVRDPADSQSGFVKTNLLSLVSFLWQVIVFLWTALVGACLTQVFLGSFVIVGWSYRLCQRTILKYWWEKSSASKNGLTFPEFAKADYGTQDLVRWPNWIVGQDLRRQIRIASGSGFVRQVLAAFRGGVHSLIGNIKFGIQGVFNTWVLTLPGCTLWLFAWYDGWNNSFNKGYEQAIVGPLTGIFGVLLFIAAMYYVPMAQMRQASTGQWRSFYQFGLVWGIIRRQWLACMGLAVLYSIFWAPVMFLKTMPGFFPQMRPSWGEISSEEAIRILSQYFFWSGLLVFLSFVFLHLVAARIYAAGLLRAVQKGAVTDEMLGEREWEALHRLDLLHLKPEPKPSRFVRAIAWAGTRAGRAAAGVLIFFIWFSFVAQIYISEFFTYHPKIGWMNQPLIQLPYFKYIPAHLK